MYIFIAATAFFFLIVMPLVVTALEYNHFWVKLYNKISPKLGLLPKDYNKSRPNTVEHEWKIFKRYTIIGLVLELITLGVYFGIHYL